MLGLCKSSLYYRAKPQYSSEEIKILHRMDEIFTEHPFTGHRKIHKQLLREGFLIGKERVLKYMHTLGLETIYPKRKRGLSNPNKNHIIYPYLLRDIEINRPNQVWAIDITYIRMVGGFIYLVAIIDWYSRYLLAYRLSNSLEVYFCKEALLEALEKYPKPEISNSDQGSQFTSAVFTKILLDNDIRISMDSKGRAIDNIAIERFFRSLKYEKIYINEYKTVKEVKEAIKDYIQFYNNKRLHQSLEYNTPSEIYYNLRELKDKESKICNI
jgi:putative transposase